MAKNNGHTSRHSNGHSLVGSVKAGEILGKSPRTIRRWCADGLIKAHRHKGDWAIDLTNFLIEKTVQAHLSDALASQLSEAQAPSNPFPRPPIASDQLRPNDAAASTIAEHLKKGFA